MNDLWAERSQLASKYYYDGFYALEERWDELYSGDSGFVGEEEQYRKELSKFGTEVAAYFDKVLNLPTEPNLRNAYLERMDKEKTERRQAKLRAECGGDPEEEIWHGMTRWDVVHHFKRDKHYSIQDVAGELGIDYMDAYKHIAPWLKNQGFRAG
jgi:hypothetical protein